MRLEMYTGKILKMSALKSKTLTNEGSQEKAFGMAAQNGSCHKLQMYDYGKYLWTVFKMGWPMRNCKQKVIHLLKKL